MKTAMQLLETVTETSRKLGPYVLLEVLLPGGTLFALMLFVYRHPTRARRYAERARDAAARALTKARRAIVLRAARAPSLTMGLETAVRALG